MKAVREASKRSLLASVLRRCDHAGKPLLWGPVVGLAGVLLFAAAAAIVWGADPALQPVPPGPIIGVSPWQGLGPAAPYPICGVDCTNGCANCFGRPRECRWEDARLIAWQAYAQGEYVGHARTEHVPEYRLRVDDQLDMLYRVTRDEIRTQYKLNVGDEVRIESFTDPELNRSLMLQPDGMITLRLLGQVHAAGSTVTQLRDTLEELYKKYYKVPSITVTPTKVNTQLDDLRSVVDRHYGVGGQGAVVRVAPDGTISLTAIGHVRAQGLTLDELRQEINERYREKIEGMEIIPVLTARAPRYVHVLGEVRAPGRFEMLGPTTALQALAMAGSWNVGANISQVVVFRRGDDWRLMATMIDLEAALRGKQPCPRGEIWLDDSDVIIVPKGRILEADDFINLLFTRGLYGVFPLQPNLTFAKLATI
jgi:polysaccharide export outer membrane protein